MDEIKTPTSENFIPEDLKIENESPLDSKIRDIARSEVRSAMSSLSPVHTFKHEETGKITTIIEVCRRCHEGACRADLDNYCEECYKDVNDWRRKHKLL